MTDRKQHFLPARSAIGYLSGMKNIGYVKIETETDAYVFEVPLANFDRLGRQIRAARLPPRQSANSRDGDPQ